MIGIKKINAAIIEDNDDFVAINKPSGLLTIPDRAQSEKSLKEFLQEKYGEIYVVHRLDKDTSGIVLFAKNADSHKYLSQLFSDRKVNKFYLGILVGQLKEFNQIVDQPIAEHPTKKGTMYVHRNGKPSQTGFQLLDSNRYFSLVEFQLFTGRTHQIRVHSKEIGHPLVCDPIYGDGESIYLSKYKKKFNLGKNEEDQPLINRLALHSYRIEFVDKNGKAVSLEAAAPKEFNVLMKQLGKQ